MSIGPLRTPLVALALLALALVPAAGAREPACVDIPDDERPPANDLACGAALISECFASGAWSAAGTSTSIDTQWRLIVAWKHWHDPFPRSETHEGSGPEFARAGAIFGAIPVGHVSIALYADDVLVSRHAIACD